MPAIMQNCRLYVIKYVIMRRVQITQFSGGGEGGRLAGLASGPSVITWQSKNNNLNNNNKIKGCKSKPLSRYAPNYSAAFPPLLPLPLVKLTQHLVENGGKAAEEDDRPGWSTQHGAQH